MRSRYGDAVVSTWDVARVCVSASLSDIVSDGLRLRKLAKSFLADASPAVIASAWRDSRRCSAQGWDIFLRTERCAIWLYDQLSARGLAPEMHAAARAALQDARQREMRRVLTARAQLSEIAEIACDLSAPLLVLKGGAAVLQGRPVLDLSDIDIMPLVDEIAQFASRLDSLGYTQSQNVERAAHHLLPRTRARSLDVEIHSELKAFNDEALAEARGRVITFAAMPKLARLSHRDHLWHVLMHVVMQHTERTAAIRDLLLIRSAAEDCSAEEMDDVRQRINASHLGATLGTVLNEALYTGKSGAGRDPFFALSATRYACAATVFAIGRVPSALIWRPLKNLTLAVAVDRKRLGSSVRDVVLPAPVASQHLWGIGRWPRIAHLGLVAMRVVRLIVLAPLAVCLAVRSLRVARSLQGRLTLPEPQTSVNHIVPATGFRRTVSSQPLQAIGATHE